MTPPSRNGGLLLLVVALVMAATTVDGEVSHVMSSADQLEIMCGWAALCSASVLLRANAGGFGRGPPARHSSCGTWFLASWHDSRT